MQAKTYDINDLQNRRLFYILNKITDDSVKLFRRTPAGDEEYTQYSLHRMPDGKLLIAFFDYWSNPTIHSLVAKFNGQEELVNTNPFERVMPYWNPSLDYENRGVFVFTNSKPIYGDPDDWRCDNTFYGPERYVTPDGDLFLSQITLEELTVYEPIISIDGIATLMYISIREEEYLKNCMVNEDIIPSSAITLSEMFRLIIEWATLAEAPFNSTEPIVLDAKEFLNKIEFDSSLVADQTNMQVAQFFLGNTDARRRPVDAVGTNQDLLDFIKRKMAHMSLASLLSCYPEYSFTETEIQFDIESAYKEFDDDLKSSKTPFDGSLDDYENALQFAPENHKLKFALKWSVLKQSKDLALSLMSNQ